MILAAVFIAGLPAAFFVAICHSLVAPEPGGP
jgi:hypothetical protein